MILSGFGYIICPERTGRLDEDVRSLLTLNGHEKTWRHVLAVANENAAIARRYGLDEDRACAAGLLHDVSAVIRRGDMLSFARSVNMPLFEAEIRYPFLLHQRSIAFGLWALFAVRAGTV